MGTGKDTNRSWYCREHRSYYRDQARCHLRHRVCERDGSEWRQDHATCANRVARLRPPTWTSRPDYETPCRRVLMVAHPDMLRCRASSLEKSAAQMPSLEIAQCNEICAREHHHRTLSPDDQNWSTEQNP